jgi:hypothetical protein
MSPAEIMRTAAAAPDPHECNSVERAVKTGTTSNIQVVRPQETMPQGEIQDPKFTLNLNWLVVRTRSKPPMPASAQMHDLAVLVLVRNPRASRDRRRTTHRRDAELGFHAIPGGTDGERLVNPSG